MAHEKDNRGAEKVWGRGMGGGVFERLQRELESQRGRDLDELVPVRGSVL